MLANIIVINFTKENWSYVLILGAVQFIRFF